MKFKDLKIRKQLGIAFTVAVVPLMFMSIVPIVKVGTLNDTAQNPLRCHRPIVLTTCRRHRIFHNGDACGWNITSCGHICCGCDILDAIANGLSDNTATTIKLANTAVQRFNDGIQQFATISEEVASNSQNLLQQADRLQDVIKFFKV